MEDVPSNHNQIVNGLVEVIEVLQRIDLSSPVAELNKVSIDDGNGGRIYL